MVAITKQSDDVFRFFDNASYVPEPSSRSPPSLMRDDSLISFGGMSAGSGGSFDTTLLASDTLSFEGDCSADVNVEVSGVSFMVSQEIFQRLVMLPMARIHAAAYRLDSVEPGTFERTLDYILFEKLPKMKKLSKDDQENLKEMAQQLGLRGLADHLSGKRSGDKKKRGTFSSLFGGSSQCRKH